MSAMKDFREFILRGNVIDLAVAVVIGGAFGAIVTAFVKDLVTPLVGIPGKLDLSAYKFSVHGSVFQIGDFLNTILSFLIIALVVFFLIVRPVNYLMSRRKTETPVDPVTRECPFCVSSIPLKATRCAFCTSEVPQTAV